MSGKKDNHFLAGKTILYTCLVVVLMIGIMAGNACHLNPGQDTVSPRTQVTVSFDSTGGSRIESQTVPTGGKLSQIETPIREGYLFSGWYYEEAPVNAVREDDTFTVDTTLYAGWYEPNVTVDKAEYMRDCDSNISFVVHSEEVLSNDNLSDYIHFACVGIEDEKTLAVRQQDDGYLLYSPDGFTPGFTYSIQLADTKKVRFVKAGDKDVSGSGITSYNFTIYRENENNVKMKVEPKLLLSDDVADFIAVREMTDGDTNNEADIGKTIYGATLIKDKDFQVGDIISFGSGEAEEKGNQYYKVCKVTQGDHGLYLELIVPNMNDIYSEYEMYYSGDAAYLEEDTEKHKELEESLLNSVVESEGYEYLCATIAEGIVQSPTLQSTVKTLDENSQQQFLQLSTGVLSDLLKNVKLNISFGKTQDIAKKDNGCYGKISFTTGEINIKLDDDIDLIINLSMKEDIVSTAYGWQKLDGAKLYLDNGVYINNTFSMSFSAVIETSSDTINITEEIQNLIASQSDDKTTLIANNLNRENLFGEDLDYIEILSKELGNKTIDIYEILSVQFTLDFKVSLGVRAGLDLNFSSTELRKIGMSNIDYSSGRLATSKMNYYSERLRSEAHFTALLKGQIGIRAGFEVGVNFSVIHMNEVLNFGFSAELGIYEEISGYMLIDYEYTYTQSDTSSDMSLAGGLKSETGIYIALEFTWNLFGWDDSVTIAEMKFPILTIGALEFASEFKEQESAITFNTKTYNLKNSGNTNLLALKYINISGGTNGVTINIKPANLSGDYAFYLMPDKTGKGGTADKKYVTVDRNTGMVTIADNAPERLDFTVTVQYTKGCSIFSDSHELITKDINLTYMKVKVNDSTKKYKATFYKPDGSVLEQKEYYIGQIPVPPSSDSYETLFIFSKYKIRDWSKPWKESFTAIYQDMSYHLDYELNYMNITFYGDVYQADKEAYRYDVISVVPTLCGDIPVPPTTNHTAWYWTLYDWSPSLRKADSDYSYYAIYKQSDDACLTSFCLNDMRRVSAGYVKKGTVPKAPDMSQYNTNDTQFAEWWPSLHASMSNSEVYIAIFRNLVTVQFIGRDGKVISEQRILAGSMPKIPETDDILPGDEDYYEYHFSHWSTTSGAKPGPVYSDTSYLPVYDKQYLEVTTIFDAGEHTFADGTKIKEFKGAYVGNDHSALTLLYLPKVTYHDEQYTYTTDYWQSTEKVNGSFVKLYSYYTYYKYNLTFKPVFKSVNAILYTVRFDGGDQTLYLTGHYGDAITSDMLSDLKKTSPSSNFVYLLKDYGLTLPYRFGTVKDQDGLPVEYISVIARFESAAVPQTLTFDANGGTFIDGQTVQTITAPYGTAVSFGKEPIKEGNSLFHYEFIGWSSDPNATTGNRFSNYIANANTTYYAVYSQTEITYKIIFDAGNGYFEDGTKTIERIYHSGEKIVLPKDPAQDETDLYRYEFLGWHPEFPDEGAVTGNQTYTASYEAIDKRKTLTFDANSGTFIDGQTIKTKTALIGTSLSFDEKPQKADDNHYHYEFIGWSTDQNETAGSSLSDFTVNENTTYYAVYNRTERTYKIIFNAGDGHFEDGTKTIEQAYHYGEIIVMPEDPVQDETDVFKYEFLGWQPGFPDDGTVTGDQIYTASYKAAYQKKTVTFDANGGQFIAGQTVKTLTTLYGTRVSFSEKPEKIDEDLSPYEFIGWSLDKDATTGTSLGSFVINKDVTFYAIYSKIEVEYTIIFDAGDGHFEDGTKTIEQAYHYGEIIVLPKDPVQDETDVFKYEFLGWQPDLPDDGTVTGDQTYTASYKAAYQEKTVTFDANGGQFIDGQTVKTKTALYGTSLSFDEQPQKADDTLYHYELIGWSPDQSAVAGNEIANYAVTENITFYAVYSQTAREYKIIFKAGGGYFDDEATAIEQTYRYGEKIVPPKNPVLDETDLFRYEFLSWQPELDADGMVTGDQTYTASFEAIDQNETTYTGITVSDGIRTESLYFNSIPGYTYDPENESGPTLIITGNDLILSGSSDSVCVLIQSDVTEVTFKDLVLSGAYPNAAAVLDTTNSELRLNINIIGNCVVCNTENARQAIRFERPVLISGTRTHSKLSVSAKGYFESVYCGDVFDVDSLELEITAYQDDGEDDFIGSPIGGEHSDENWRFRNSTIRLISEGDCCGIPVGVCLENTHLTAIGKGSAVIMGQLQISGSSVVDIEVDKENKIALIVDELLFNDLTGSFAAGNTHASAPGIAVMATAIRFIENGAEVGTDGYDLGGTEIATFRTDDYSFSSFGISVDGTLLPVSSVNVKRKIF